MRRSLTPELMDDPSLDPAEHARALRGLARLNALAASDRILWGPIRRAARARRGPVSVMDVATGSGDIPVALARRAAREGITLELHACDLSETALRHARERAERENVRLQVFRHDATAEPFDRRFDIVTSSLFLHHLDDVQADAFLRNAAAATGSMLLVSDLRRGIAGLAVAWGASRLATRSRVVHADAVKSVLAAYTAEEMANLAKRAGLDDANVHRRWPWRMLLTWRRR